MENKVTVRNPITEGCIWKGMLLFALPIMLGSLLQQLYNMVDSVVVGNYVGSSALTAVGAGFSIMFLISSLFLGFSMGATIMIAQYVGAGDQGAVGRTVDTIYSALLVIIVPLTLLGVLASGPLLTLIRVPQEAYEQARTYCMVVLGGIIGTLGYNMNSGIMRGLGDSRTPLIFLFIACVINIVLDPIFILILGMGAGGAALATVIGNGAVTVYLLLFIKRKAKVMCLDPRLARHGGKELGKVLAIGLPNGVGSILSGFASTFSNQLLAGYGTGAIAAMAAAGRGTMIVDYLVMAVCMGCQSIIAYSYGARNMERLREIMRKLLILVAGLGFAVLALCLIFREGLIGLFLKEEAAGLMGQQMLCILMLSAPLIGVGYLITSYFQARNCPVKALVISVLRQGALLIPCLYLLNCFWKLWGVVWANTAACILAALIAVGFYLVQKKIDGKKEIFYRNA